jgi:signal transduction histidine kinase
MAQATAAIFYVSDVSFRLIPTSIYSINSLLIGSLAEMTLFSLALADRIGGAKKALAEQQIRQAQEREKLIEEKNKELEGKIQERTLALQKINEALQQSNKTKDKLFSIIAHDLRSPMAALSGTLDILNLDVLTQQELDEVKKELKKQFSVTDTTLQNLLIWAKSQMQSETTNPVLITLSNMVNEHVTLFEKLAREKQISLVNRVGDAIQVFADGNHLRTILRNLLANALKFSYPEGQIEITGRPEGEMVVVAVKDSGMGMSAAEQAKVFSDMYFSKQGTSGEQGSGLGLVLVKELVEKDGGKIWLESTKGEGSCFYFTLRNAKP